MLTKLIHPKCGVFFEGVSQMGRVWCSTCEEYIIPVNVEICSKCIHPMHEQECRNFNCICRKGI